jgi:hypothetical protein
MCEVLIKVDVLIKISYLGHNKYKYVKILFFCFIYMDIYFFFNIYKIILKLTSLHMRL